MRSSWLPALAASVSALGPPSPEGMIERPSTLVAGASVSFKEVPAEICGTAVSYAGYVRFPPNTMMDYPHENPINIFFWYFEAQSKPERSPTVGWINGGPGASSMFGLMTENGPCQVQDDLTTKPNPWSWNLEHNMLYVDQPIHTGFSYDVPTPGWLDVKSGNITIKPSPQTSGSSIAGIFSSQDVKATANTTAMAARQYWNFLQVWTHDFLADRPHRDAFALWAESYGGRYGPAFADYIRRQDARIRAGKLRARPLNLEALGIVNGCIDLALQESSYPDFAYGGNPYRIRAINSSEHAAAVAALPECRSRIDVCLHGARHQDPDMTGSAADVNTLCRNASDFCQNEVEAVYMQRSHRGYYDVTHCSLDPFPSNRYLDYLAQPRVLAALGVPVNYTDGSNAVVAAFNSTGDYARRIRDGGFVGALGRLLDSGVYVSLLYGDSDYACNWIGGETVSYAVPWSGRAAFASAGYADLTTGLNPGLNPGPTTGPDAPTAEGQVRQHGLFSFVRVFFSSHMIPSSRPEASYRIFQRLLGRRDIATGQRAVDAAYFTNGRLRSTVTHAMPPSPTITCYLRALASACAQNQMDAVTNGTAVVLNGIVVQPLPPPDACPSPVFF
ncbi:Carboxypeptidase S1 [Ophiocordyceps camponoti-floridani]|uniref:Carboxypeptidase n=1 Tax=Ophiocordyceps camponoti-floridani TaxID=2030778 RepID=A0A8H4VFM1_9HYPO|nr:Carboxypeptidase S1 [Ophiocordyceps camponoti-floridani]